ncbi:putative membrane protein [Pseudarthrobacter defluvii]|uniref:hypothetical protein n=1 Tax=Pseudarthrobacter defluvii TaxID=410837 RepID=UPI002784C796|nr:hypothetical protein [Pseudarthrobacter defluvii]MDQ0770128.1 putative membrane protein [Pseudarthrobacter defluvii]
MTLLQASPNRMLLACSAALIAASFLNACAAPGNGLQREAATQLQARVLEVTQASSQNDPASALKALEGLEADLSAAQAKGQVSDERRRSITTVATAVRADLNEAVAAQKAAAPKAPADAPAAAAQGTETPSPAPEAPASQPAPAPAPAPAADQGNAASGNGGNAGKNNGDKGKGKN